MTGRGKHASDDISGFYRQLAVMILGILVVGAISFLILVWIADNPNETTTITSPPPTTSTTVEVTTTETDPQTTTTAQPTTTAVPVRPPAEVRVQVLNSMGLAGAAGRLTQELGEAGYQTLPADDFTPEQDPSRVWYREGFTAEANQLLAFIPDAQVEAMPDESVGAGADVVIVLGTGYEE